MTETSRRGKILREIASGRYSTIAEIESVYSPEIMLKNRLGRLEELGEIRRVSDGRYVYVGRGLIVFAQLFEWCRHIVLGRLSNSLDLDRYQQ